MKSNALRRFLANKNTVTILGTLVMILVLYVGFNATVQSATNPVWVVYAKETIQPRTKITADMLGEKKVPLAMVQGADNVLRTKAEVIDKYTNVNTLIPKFSLIYKEAILEKDKLPDVAVLDVPDGQVLFNLPVSTETTYGNSMYPGNYFDLYFKSTDDSNRVQYGKLVNSVKILAVKSSDGSNVFENSDQIKQPAMLIFALPNNLNIMLKKAIYLKDYNAELLPVPVKETTSKNTILTPTLASTYLASFINAKTVNVPIDQIINTADTTINAGSNEDA